MSVIEDIHQQLATSHKLFCACKAELSSSEPEITFYRRLRPTQSELGYVDPAAAFEFTKGRGFLYEVDRATACLVEMDEEPPHALNEEAVDIGLMAALMMGATPVDEIHVMRKIVIDGSTTTGFQRTCIIALGGEITVDGEKIQLQALCLEEDAARKTGETALTTRYRLDRLCIPLIEISTAPVIFTPQAAERAALALGRLLRATKRVKRGLGTIRQDLNISIRGGAITEIKGVQELNLVSTYVAYEVKRQLALLTIRDELTARGVEPESLSPTFVDVTKIFNTTRCALLAKAVKHGARVMAVILPKFKGLLGRELIPSLRFGTELSYYAKFWGRVGGIFHTDELPAYGISVAELDALTKTLAVGAEDAVVFVAAEPEHARDALTAVVERVKQAVEGVPHETRGAASDGVTHYARPRPGAARMYPETDVPPFPVTREYLARVRANLPESPDEKLSRLKRVYGLNDQLATQLSDSPYDEVFERIATTTEVAPSFLAATLTETLKSLRREGVDIEYLSDGMLVDVFKDVDDGVLAKEVIPDVLRWMGTHKGTGVRDALDALGVRMVPSGDVEQVVDEIVAENEALVRQRGRSAFGPLMGVLMKKYRGRIDAKKASHLLREKLRGKGA